MAPVPDHAPLYVSVVNEFPQDLYDAMCTFVETHPQWDQYRLMQVALAEIEEDRRLAARSFRPTLLCCLILPSKTRDSISVNWSDQLC